MDLQKILYVPYVGKYSTKLVQVKSFVATIVNRSRKKRKKNVRVIIVEPYLKEKFLI